MKANVPIELISSYMRAHMESAGGVLGRLTDDCCRTQAYGNARGKVGLHSMPEEAIVSRGSEHAHDGT
jgi:hypothetical protein